jgi:DtxR family Mn-dependent transcriptional regulator
MPELPGWYQKIRARFPGKKKNNKTDEKRLPENGAIVLTELAGGTSARIVSINNTDRRMLDTLFSFGALPGTVIELIRKYPAYVLRIGASVFTIDAELARSIFVKTI